MALAWRVLADPGTVRAVAGLPRRATPVMALMMMEWAIMLLVAGMESECFCNLEKVALRNPYSERQYQALAEAGKPGGGCQDVVFVCVLECDSNAESSWEKFFYVRQEVSGLSTVRVRIASLSPGNSSCRNMRPTTYTRTTSRTFLI